jgi:hypothetical protein
VALVVDGAEWNFNGWTADEVSQAISALIARVWTAQSRGEAVWIGDELQTRYVIGEFDLWSMFSPTAPIKLSTELAQELAAWLGAAPRYLEEPWPPGMEEILIQVDHFPPQENTDLAWAHHHVRNGRAVACLSLRRSGPHPTASSQGTATVHWILNESTNRAFWRAAIDLEGGSAEILERLAPHAFPDLYFYAGVWQGLKRFAGGYLAMRADLQRYLVGLDDHGAWAFRFPPPALEIGEPSGPDLDARPSNQIIESRFRRLSLEMAPENPNVYADTFCRRAREITIYDKILYCEWHGKLEMHRNRVHVHPPDVVSGGKVIIAIFHEHLPLPT